jgi:two-component system, OmpR family, sensor histidine kinase SenX3
VEWKFRRARSGDGGVVDAPLGAAGDGPPSLSRSALDALQVGVLVLDGSDRPVLVNSAARDMGLVRTRTLAGNNGVSTTTEEAHTIVRTLAGQVRRAGITRVVELDLPRATPGDPLGVHVRVVSLGGGNVAVEAADVTEAHRVARVRRDFVANVSHELKTPVGALQLLAEALMDAMEVDHEGTGNAADPDAARRFAERIRHESARLARLVSELLELSRLQGAEPLPEPEPVSVDRILTEVIDRTKTPGSIKDIEIGVTGRRGLTVYGNENQLVTAVVNLVENAIAYSAESTTVKVSVASDGDTVGIAVIDEGIGIEPRDLDRIFERFYRADRARSRATGGTGLGLAIVKHIATNHGGRVDVTSAVGVGSTFTLRLPARPLEAAMALPPSVEIERPSSSGES